MEMPFVSSHSLLCDCLQGCLKSMTLCVFNNFSNPPFEGSVIWGHVWKLLPFNII